MKSWRQDVPNQVACFPRQIPACRVQVTRLVGHAWYERRDFSFLGLHDELIITVVLANATSINHLTGRGARRDWFLDKTQLSWKRHTRTSYTSFESDISSRFQGPTGHSLTSNLRCYVPDFTCSGAWVTT